MLFFPVFIYSVFFFLPILCISKTLGRMIPRFRSHTGEFGLAKLFCKALMRKTYSSGIVASPTLFLNILKGQTS